MEQKTSKKFIVINLIIFFSARKRQILCYVSQKSKHFLMIKWILLSVSLCSFSCLNTLSQDSLNNKAKHFISIQTGYSMHFVQDQVISPLVYKGSQLPLFLNFEILNKKSSQLVSICYDNLKLSSSITTNYPTPSFYTQNYNAFFEYSYLRSIYQFPLWKIKVFAGGTFKTLLNYRDHFYGGDTNYSYGEFIASIDISFMIIKRFKGPNDNFISFRFDMPVLAYDFWNYL